MKDDRENVMVCWIQTCVIYIVKKIIFYGLLIIVVYLRSHVLQEIDESGIEPDVKNSVKESVESYAVALLMRFKCLNSETSVACANIHVAYDEFKRQDKQCLQVSTFTASCLNQNFVSMGYYIKLDYNPKLCYKIKLDIKAKKANCLNHLQGNYFAFEILLLFIIYQYVNV